MIGNLQKANREKADFSNLLGSRNLRIQYPTNRKNKDHNFGHCIDDCTGGATEGICWLFNRKCVDLGVG